MKYTLALCQTKGLLEKSKAYTLIEEYVTRAASNGANVVSLTEMWNCPYSSKYFREFSETTDGPTVAFMSKLAAKNKVLLIGGSIPELDDEKVYNTSYIFSSSGDLIGKHRKVHLFDIDIKGGLSFKESKTLSAGDKTTVFDTEFGKIGVAICYDVRFSSMFIGMAQAGANLIVLPGAFNMTTGPAHWELLMRARALDNQIYFAACSPARDLDAPYHAFGHSCIVNPWGDFCGKTDSNESIVYGVIDYDYLNSIREQLPLKQQSRFDIY